MTTGVEQLPRGRHGLPRETVRASQRGRMLDAMARAVADRGYANVTVADVLRGARVSRETFYEHFSGKEACFLAALDASADALAGRMTEALATGGRDPLDRLDRVLAVYLDALAAERALARTFLLDVHAAGPEALRRRVAVFERFVALVAGILGADDDEGRFACEVLVGAVSSMVTMRAAADDLAALPALREPLMAIARRML